MTGYFGEGAIPPPKLAFFRPPAVFTTPAEDASLTFILLVFRSRRGRRSRRFPERASSQMAVRQTTFADVQRGSRNGLGTDHPPKANHGQKDQAENIRGGKTAANERAIAKNRVTQARAVHINSTLWLGQNIRPFF
jgi:hypothetical protein